MYDGGGSSGGAEWWLEDIQKKIKSVGKRTQNDVIFRWEYIFFNNFIFQSQV